MKNIFIFIILLIFYSCSTDKKNIKELIIEKEVKIDKDSVFFNNLSSIEIYDDKFLFIDWEMNNRSIIMTDSNLNYLGAILFKDRDFMFNGRIFGSVLKDSILYLLDNTFYEIKEYNLQTDELKKISFEKGSNIYDDVYNMNTIAIIDDTNYVATNIGLNLTGYNSDSNYILVGKLYDSKMKNKINYRVKFEDLEYPTIHSNNRGRIFEEIYVSYNDNKIFFCCRISSMIFVFDKNGNLLKKKKINHEKKDIEYTDDGRRMRSLKNVQSLQFDDYGNVYKLNLLLDKTGYIAKYDKDFNIIKIYTFPKKLDMPFVYTFKLYKNKFIIADEYESKIYLLKE